MKHLILSLLAFTASALLIPSVSDAAPGGSFGSKLHSRLTVSVDLLPTAEGIFSSAGTVEIKVKQKDTVQQAKLELSVDGLPAGAYSVDATLEDGSAVHLGDFQTDGSAPVSSSEGDDTETDDNDLEMTLPSTIDARTIATVTVSVAGGAVVLEGDADASVERESFFANVAVTGADNVRGHALLISKTEAGEETDRHVLFIGFGAASSTTLTINVDGIPAGTVESTKQGRVKFQDLDAAITLSTIHMITLTDETNTVVMQAQF